MNDKMSTEELTAQYVDKLLDFHLSNQTAPSQYLTWGEFEEMSNLIDGQPSRQFRFGIPFQAF